ncbi:TPA: recombinase family protein [Streptococcus equi subsp. zooepidemicus]|nr:recombinase family protein [Streptococcus equi subsp. zooepidemicus]
MVKQIEVIRAHENVRRNHGKIEISQKRVAAYCRVSTDSEDQKNSYESQVKHYKEYISQRSDWQLVDIYADEGITGTQVGKRQDFQRLITDCLNGEIDYIVTKAIARFARNTLDTLKYVRMLKDKQIGVYFEEENIDTLTMDGELLLTILSSVAQQEVENISAHVKKGLKMKMQRGELVGGPRCLGYDFDWETRQITVNQEEAKIVRYIFDRYLEGIGGRVIARELEEMGVTSPRGNKSWAETTILGVIKNEKYKGDVLQGKTFTVDPISKRRLDNYGEEDQYYIKGNHEPIVTEEEFNQAQEIRLRRSGRRGRIGSTSGKRQRFSRMYAFSSMLECGFCQSVLSRRSWHSGTIYHKVIWHCQVAIKKGKRHCQHSKGISESAIEKAFLESFRLLYQNNDKIIDLFLQTVEEEISDNSLELELQSIEKKLMKLKQQERDIIQMKLDGRISDDLYDEKFHAIKKDKEKLSVSKVNLEVRLRTDSGVKERLESFRKLLKSKQLISEFDRAIFESLVEKVIIGGISDDGVVDPAKITFIYKSGDETTLNSKNFKDKRKNESKKSENASSELCSNDTNNDEKLSPQSTDTKDRGCSEATEATKTTTIID